MPGSQAWQAGRTPRQVVNGVEEPGGWYPGARVARHLSSRVLGCGAPGCQGGQEPGRQGGLAPWRQDARMPGFQGQAGKEQGARTRVSGWRVEGRRVKG